MNWTKLKGTLQLRLIYLIFGYSTITPRWGSKPMPQTLYPHLNSIGKHALIKNQNVMKSSILKSTYQSTYLRNCFIINWYE